MTTIMQTPATVMDEQAVALSQQVNRIAEAATDMRGNIAAVRAELVPGDLGTVAPFNRVRLLIGGRNGAVPVLPNENAHVQLAQRIVPGAARWTEYYRFMMQEYPDLAVTNINAWLARANETRLLRLLKPITADDETRLGAAGAAYTLRAVLGPTYRPIDNAGLLNFILPTAQAHGLRVKEWNLDEKRFNVRFVGRERPVQDIVAEVRDRPRDEDLLQEEVAREQGRTGALTSWVVSQGITALARRGVEDGTMAYDRKVELERLGWDIIENGAVKLAREASKN